MRTSCLLAFLLLLVPAVGCDDGASSSPAETEAQSPSLSDEEKAELAGMMSEVHETVMEQAESAASLSAMKPALEAAKEAQASPRLRNIIVENDETWAMADSGTAMWSYGGTAVATVDGATIYEGEYGAPGSTETMWIVTRPVKVAGGAAELLLVVEQ